MTESKTQGRQVSSHQRRVLRQRARCMRHEPTHTEWLLWQSLRAGQLGVTFRRQVVLQGYIADFYASEARLIIEVDGGWHGGRRADVQRDRHLAASGYRVLRIPAAGVESALAAVVQRIAQELTH